MAGLAALVLLASPSLAAGDQAAQASKGSVQLAHMGRGQGGAWRGQPCPMGTTAPGMMRQGMMGQGPGMMGPGMMGQGMMGPGMGGKGMMGPGFGRGPGHGDRVTPMKHLTTDDVRHFLEHRLEMRGNKRLEVGEVKEADEDKIVAEITTVDGSLVERLEVDRHTGQMRHVE